MSPPDSTHRPSTDATVILPSLATSREPWYARLREELTLWNRRGRVDDAVWEQSGLRCMVAMEQEVLVLEAYSLACAGSMADLAPRVLDLQRRAPELVWRIDTRLMTILASTVCRNAQRMAIDEIAARLLDLMQRYRHLKAFSDGRQLDTTLIDLDRRAGDMDARIRYEMRIARTRNRSGLPPFVERLRVDLERALSRVLGFSRDDLQGIIEVIATGRIEEDDLRRLIGYMHAEREAHELTARYGPPDDQRRIWQLMLVQDNQWEDVDVRPLSRRVDVTSQKSATPAAEKQEGSATASISRTEQSQTSAATASPSPAAQPVTTTQAGAAAGTPATPTAPTTPPQPRPPHVFAEALSRLVIGQDEAVRAWALALHQHEAGVHNRGAMLLDGPTGCGKSHLGICAAELAGVPFIHVNAASLVPEGIVGQTLSDVCIAAITKANGDVAVAERCVILFDEIDKLSDAMPNERLAKYGTEIIHQLLRFLDGCDYFIDSYKTPTGKKFPQTLSTRKMLIAFSGAWTCLRSAGPTTSIGFAANSITPEPTALAVTDLGLPLEMVGRIARVVHLEPHTIGSLMGILTSEAASPLRGVRAYLAERQASLTIDEQLLMSMAASALGQGTGARALATIAMPYTDGIYWNAPVDGKRFHLTASGTLQVENGPAATTVAA